MLGQSLRLPILRLSRIGKGPGAPVREGSGHDSTHMLAERWDAQQKNALHLGNHEHIVAATSTPNPDHAQRCYQTLGYSTGCSAATAPHGSRARQQALVVNGERRCELGCVRLVQGGLPHGLYGPGRGQLLGGSGGRGRRS